MKSVRQLLAEMDAAPAGTAKRPADQVGGGDPAPAPVAAAPAGALDLGDAQANRPADAAKKGDDGQNPPQGSSEVVPGESVPVDPNLHWDEYQKQLQAGAHGADLKPMSEAEHLVTFKKEDFGNIFSEAGFSDESIAKAITIFESAVNGRIKKEIARLNSVANAYFTEGMKEASAKLIKENEEKTEKYLDYVVSEWTKENKLAIESGLRVQLAENFLAGMKALFLEHNIEIPVAKVDLVDSLTEKNSELEAKVNEGIEREANLHKMLKEAAKDVQVLEFTRGMTAVKAEKIKELAESVVFTTPTEFAAKLKTLEENFTAPSKGKTGDDGLIVENTGKPTGVEQPSKVEEIPEMGRYLKTSQVLTRK